MKHPRESETEKTTLESDVIGDLAPVTIFHPPGTYSLTPASTICLQAISRNRSLFRGIGIDWGCGTGGLGIVLAKIPEVARVIGLELSSEDVATATRNARANCVEDKFVVLHSDSFTAKTPPGKAILDQLEGRVGFLIANPPASRGDDGFQLRRTVLSGLPLFLADDASVCLQISIQYGWKRILNLTSLIPGLSHERVLASTPWVPFDLGRTDLRRQLDEYVSEEDRGGLVYTFGDPDTGGESCLDAHEALDLYARSGRSPLTQWQVHLFKYKAC